MTSWQQPSFGVASQTPETVLVAEGKDTNERKEGRKKCAVMEEKMCSFIDSAWRDWAVWISQGTRKVWLGRTSADAVCVVRMQFSQIGLRMLHQYLFVDQHGWLMLTFKPAHSKICRKSLLMTLKIADALMALSPYLKVPWCSGGCSPF